MTETPGAGDGSAPASAPERWRGDNRCPTCGYILHDAFADTRCSECGFIEPDARLVVRAWLKPPSTWAVLGLGVVMLAILARMFIWDDRDWFEWALAAFIGYSLFHAIRRLRLARRGAAELYFMVTEHALIAILADARRTLPRSRIREVDRSSKQGALRLTDAITIGDHEDIDTFWLDAGDDVIDAFEAEIKYLQLNPLNVNDVDDDA